MNMVVICWKIRIFAYWTTPWLGHGRGGEELWFAEKFVSLLIEQHPVWACFISEISCDLLKNSYLCLLNNTCQPPARYSSPVVICWKIRIFAYWTTPLDEEMGGRRSCDLLKNSYLCLLNNTWPIVSPFKFSVVICWKIRIFAYWTTPVQRHYLRARGCDLLKNSYLCLLNNTGRRFTGTTSTVVICWKIRIFAYWTTPLNGWQTAWARLWFAEKFVSLLIEQHHMACWIFIALSCDLLKNSYLCLLNNTRFPSFSMNPPVVICWKIRIFAYWTTPQGRG